MGAMPLHRIPAAKSALTVIPHQDGRRGEAETYIREVFARSYGARVVSFAPQLALLEKDGRILAAAGWRGGDGGGLYLERYLDRPVEDYVSGLAGVPVARERIVEVGNLAAGSRGAGAGMILAMAAHLDTLGYEWVVFTATHDLVGLFARMALPPLAIAPADPARLGDAAGEWGNYYQTRPVVVAGRIRLAAARMCKEEAAA